MPLLDFFKKKTKKEKAAFPKDRTRKEAKKAVEKTKKGETRKTSEIKEGPKVKRKKATFSYSVLESPHITEKVTDLTKKNQYVFRVWPKKNKTAIKKTIEDLYEVDVLSIRIINVPEKKRRLGKSKGWRPSYKKAIITIKEGQKIEILPR